MRQYGRPVPFTITLTKSGTLTCSLCSVEEALTTSTNAGGGSVFGTAGNDQRVHEGRWREKARKCNIGEFRGNK